MSEITVKKVKPCELTAGQIIRLKNTYKTELKDFVVFYNNKQKELLVNKVVPESDVQIFVRAVMYKGQYLEDENGGVEEFEYIFATYDFPIYAVIVDAWKARKYDDYMEKAKAEAPGIVKMIDTFLENDDEPRVLDEFLAYQVMSLADNAKRKAANNLVGADTEYVFYFGYLIGKGTIVL